jgi:uncharacterized protein YprB with RNaseH-like and TPR domain
MEKPDTSPVKEKIGIFDIETTGLQANWSVMVSWCMLDHDTGDIAEDLIKRSEIRNRTDRRVIKSAIAEIKKYDRIITWYGSRFDVPYVRTKALYHKGREKNKESTAFNFPAFRDLYHTDLLYLSRSKLKLHSNRLESVCQYFGIPAKIHKMTPELNNDLQAGREHALIDVLEHCREDVWSTNEVFKMFMEHTMLHKRSI